MRFQGLCYRGHDPKWAFSPTSGAGAAIHGGRFNAPGVPALYLALTLEGLFLEVAHGFGHRFEPLTVCTYDVDAEDVVDLRTDDTRRAAEVTLADLACAWALDRASRRKPASWTATERLTEAGAAGILVPSFASGARPGMDNLVLWRWGDGLPHRVSVHDPSGRLPHDQSSWPGEP
ncbi:RES family NAD+ phosphorylase [Labrys monachus]|uniref:RES domain-containing protein n=1 Tax=Labrys monachus TaxID=217067 RepID=A0ABU0FCD4_9HYPH|nr:RES domain-containing protein [Labrys monachus]MDQ0391773.1 RES domain-containing protein [Labrys monachus]